MNKKDRIQLIENNLKEGKKRYNSGNVTREQWKRMKKDAQNRIQEIKEEK